MKNALKGLMAIAIVAAVALPLAHAQTQTVGTGIKVQPALFEQLVNPGDTFSTSITVTNPDPTAKQFTVTVENISDMTATGQPVFTSSSVPEYGLSSWVSIANPVITIPANGSAVVPFTITVPKTAAPGGHYGAIFVTLGAKRPAFTGTGIGYEVGSLIDLRIAGEATEDAQIQEFSTDKGLYQAPDVTFTAIAHNDGNVLLRPRGPIDIMNMFGQKVGEAIMNDGNAAIFPGTDRSFTAHWTGTGFMMGRFDAVMSLTYGDQGQKTVSREVSFWIIPVVPIIAVLGSILFFVLIFVWSVRAYVRRRVAAMTSGRPDRGASAEERFLAEDRLPFSRLVFILIATAIFAIVFLLVLFFFFG
ncbi:MAG TPA: hypothetical protein VMT99_02545 [Candidatus Paceibacterota bacterium]|nr:hypothetical protein [Candidatus Paceibacterota bacterium]